MASDIAIDCAICMEIMVQPVTLPCGHSICLECTNEMVRMSQANCPICRAEFQQIPQVSIILRDLIKAKDPERFEARQLVVAAMPPRPVELVAPVAQPRINYPPRRERALHGIHYMAPDIVHRRPRAGIDYPERHRGVVMGRGVPDDEFYRANYLHPQVRSVNHEERLIRENYEHMQHEQDFTGISLDTLLED
jgi:hypothetical protein